MEKFTASNGDAVTVNESGGLVIGGRGGALVLPKNAQVLREFFLHERDQELGRWRWPENPEYVVYRDDRPGGFRVMHEPTGDTWTYFWDAMKDDPQYVGPWNAARAYFAAHPEPKPWHDATDGQLWLIRFSDFPDVDVSALVKGGLFLYNDHCHEGVAPLNDSTIVAGRRVWPEAPDASE